MKNRQKIVEKIDQEKLNQVFEKKKINQEKLNRFSEVKKNKKIKIKRGITRKND